MQRNSFRCARSRAAGFTLLELLVAVTLMAVIALLGWRGLDAVISARDDITRNSDRLRALSLAFAQIEDDLRRAWFARLLVPGETVIALRQPDEGRIELELLRAAPTARSLMEPAASGLGPVDRSDASPLAPLQRVIWRLNEGRLERGQQGWLPGGAALGDWVWQPLVVGLDTIRWRLWVDGQGWVETVSPRAAGLTPSGAPGPLPSSGDPSAVNRPAAGVEITLTGRGEQLVRVLAARD